MSKNIYNFDIYSRHVEEIDMRLVGAVPKGKAIKAGK